ncbi:ribonuclease P protein component [Roseobacter sp.]|uniref:ribonuclease P protein component n=1 Tax=Roseobacter sp. TaxID=1907202 RepID=UPI00385D2643
MTPPKDSSSGHAAAGDALSAVSFRFTPLTKRADFQRASRSPRVVTDGFILQMRRRAIGEATGMRVGFTCSKKVGNAVARNRAKRRLREIARLVLEERGRDDTDYVLIGRHKTTAVLPFEQLRTDLIRALNTLHGKSK